MQWCSFCCCFSALIKCQRQSQKTKQLERKMCSQNPNTDDFNCQRRHKKDQVKWVTPSFSLLILSQAWLTSCDEKGDTRENRPRRMLTWKIHINPLVCECWQSLRLLETIHIQLLSYMWKTKLNKNRRHRCTKEALWYKNPQVHFVFKVIKSEKLSLNVFS